MHQSCVCVRSGRGDDNEMGRSLKKLLPRLIVKPRRSEVRSKKLYLPKALQVILTHSQDLSSSHTQTHPTRSPSPRLHSWVLSAKRALSAPLCAWPVPTRPSGPVPRPHAAPRWRPWPTSLPALGSHFCCPMCHIQSQFVVSGSESVCPHSSTV